MMAVVHILKFHLLIRLRICSVILFLFVIICFINGQSSNKVEQLKSKREQYINEISNAKSLLTKKGNTRREYLSELHILNSQIKAQSNIISSYSDEIIVVSDIIKSNELLVNKLSNEINDIKIGYEMLIIEANNQLNTNYNEFMLLFSASSFSEAYRRFQLMKQYSSYRKKQGEILIDTQLKHDSILVLNKEILKVKELAYNKLIQERDFLKLSISKKESYISKLLKDESWLKRDIKKKEKASKDLHKQIEKLILEASESETEYSFSNFVNAKGKLNWPVSGGVVTSNFGEHNHAVLKGVKVKNNGIDITASKENDVKSVYEGTVTRVIAIPGYNKAVIIRHGKYLTVYANLQKVYVIIGQEIKSNQFIGQIFADKKDKSGILHFEIWEESKKINPLNWLQK